MDVHIITKVGGGNFVLLWKKCTMPGKMTGRCNAAICAPSCGGTQYHIYRALYCNEFILNFTQCGVILATIFEH